MPHTAAADDVWQLSPILRIVPIALRDRAKGRARVAGAQRVALEAALGSCELVTAVEVLPRSSQGKDWQDRNGQQADERFREGAP